MTAALGRTGVLLALVACAVGAGISVFGLVTGRERSIRNGGLYAPLALVGAGVAVGAMEYALVTHNFTLQYVADNNSRETPLLYSITGLWSALAGSILLWGFLLAAMATATVVRFRKRAGDALVGWATVVLYAVGAFFFALMLGPADPFVALAKSVAPVDGTGPNVLLQDNALVAFHPPMLYLGMVGFTVPFAFAIASLVTGRMDDEWLHQTRRWTLFAWGALTVGIIGGAWWSYQVLGWGGFWAWDPVENASLMPWLVGTAYLHSVMTQERRGLLRIWNLTLVVATFSLTILGTFLTRSGVITSVHSFSTSTIGPLLLGFFGAVLAVGVGLIAWRGDRLVSPATIDAPLSREGAFLANNLLFAAFAFVVLLGTVFPLLYEALRGGNVTVGAPYFNRLTIPLGLGLLFLMGIAPAMPWRKTTAAVMRRRLAVPAAAALVVLIACVAGGMRGIEPLLGFTLGAFAGAAAVRALVLSVRQAWRWSRGAGRSVPASALSGWRGLVGRANGGMVVHIGVVIVAVGLTGATAFGHRGEVRLSPGQSGALDGHRIGFVRLAHVRTSASDANQALLTVDGGGPFRPALTSFNGSSQVVGTPSVDSGFLDDVYLTIDGAPTDGSDTYTFGVVVQPLVSWLWAGGAVIVVGAVLSVVPGRRRRRPTDPVSLPVVGSAAEPPEGPAIDAGELPEAGGDAEPEGEPVGAGAPAGGEP